ncbi:MAG: bifunctional cytidylyltransferase/SDR family oxidoreductase [Anaplasmataceae bacterium]|nr:bifunctional cytidylyltransferase/SDR family oxidoreductase [Anaplasmataceae bacterium]
MEIRAILLMGGNSERFGSATPKQFHLLVGKKVYLHTLERFLDSELFLEIVLVVPSAWITEVREDLKNYSTVQVRVVDGGSTRQESSFLGLKACPSTTNIVVIHDAVRPFVSKQILQNNIAKALTYGAADTCIPSTDTLVYAPGGDFIEEVPVRAHFLRGQTPQSFQYSLIFNAHQHAQNRMLEGISDDCRLVREYGAQVAIVPGEDANMKITTPLDMLLAEQILRKTIPLPKGLPSYNLRGAKIAITGGTGGIGRAIAALLEKEGALPLFLSRSSVQHSIDFLDAPSIAHRFKAIHEQEGPLDALINCIGWLQKAPIHEQTEEDINTQIDLNLRGVILACKYVSLKQGAQIVNIASSSYSQGRGGIAVYAATKAAVVNFTQGLAQERPDLIVNVVAPQRTDTTMRRAHFPGEDPLYLLRAEEVAEEIVEILRQGRSFQSVIEIRKK